MTLKHFFLPLSAAEFVLIKLIELGKVETDDISLLLEKFKREDADKDGHLDDDDLKHWSIL